MAEAGPSSQNLDPGGRVSKCHSMGCICCQYIRDGISTFKWNTTGKLYKIKQKMHCMTPNVIYIVECKKKQAQWIGKTSASLHDRFKAHLWPIPDNYKSKGHSHDDLSVYPIEQVDDSKNLDKRELFWIDTFNKGQNSDPCKYVKQDRRDDDSTGPGGSAPGLLVESTALSHKRKHTEHNRQKSKRMKKHERKIETEQLLSQTNDAHKGAKDALSQLYTKLKGVIQDSPFLEDLKNEITNYDAKEKIHIGLFGQTGSGKSSLINAIVNEDQLLPVGTMQACTSVYVYVQTNAESSKYSADIEFLTFEEWTSEVQLLLELIRNENDQENVGENAKYKKMAEDTITTIYGETGLRKNYNELVTATRDLPMYKTPLKPKDFNTARELSESIECYIRSNRKAKQQFWPLVKRVTISLPKSSALPEGIVLIDLPGAGDMNKQRCNMWKECLGQCSSVWIVSEMKRALDEDVAHEIFDESLRTIAGGGVCQNITFICTKIDNINPKEIIRQYDVPSAIQCNPKDPEDENRQKQQCILYLNDEFKKQINEDLEKKIKEFLHGDSEHSDEFFSAFTVSSAEYQRIAEEKPSTLEKHETGIPSVIEHLRKLYISHHEEEVKHYVSEVYAIISLFHSSKDAIVSKHTIMETAIHIADRGLVELTQLDQRRRSQERRFTCVEFGCYEGKSSYSHAFKTLEKDLNEMCKSLRKILETFQNNLKKSLDSGAEEAEKKCEKNAQDRVLEPEGCDHRGYHMTLKAMCRNNGFYRTGKGKVVDLNYTLSGPMYQKINKLFKAIFGGGLTRTSINREFESFQIQFIKNEDLRSYRQKDKSKYWRLLYIRAKQRKLISTLKKEILQRKRTIYNSLYESVCDTMRETYAECSEIKRRGALKRMKRTLESRIQHSKTEMFRDAKDRMLEAVNELKEDLVKKLQTKMTTSMRMALLQMPDDITVLQDVTEELEKIKKCCESLKLEIFE